MVLNYWDYVASNDGVVSELNRLQKEVVVVYFKVIFQHLCGGQLVCEPTFEPEHIFFVTCLCAAYN